jgi:nucleoside-diphosphate-sugar epimerase
MTRCAWVFGARGQVGRFLVPRLRAAGWELHAATRAPPPPDAPGLHWHRLDLFADTGPLVPADTLFSLGPLDGFVHWLARSQVRPRRIVAFGSTSAHSKQASPDRREQALARRLQQGEAQLHALAGARGSRATVLRPTLVYGGGGDRNLSRIAQLAQRWRVLPLPRGATGLRQPVHAEDLAQAAWSAAHSGGLPQPGYDLPGGETLPYRAMVQRVLDCLEPPPRLLPVPGWPLRVALGLAHRLGALPDASEAILHRLQRDLVYDCTAARRDLDYAPRAFVPERAMFVAPETG